MIRPILLTLLLALPLPAAAQDAPQEAPEGDMERGFRLFLDGLREEIEPGLRGLGALTRDAAPMLRDLQERLGMVVDDLDAYEAPEILPNGDILIRRKAPLNEIPEGMPDTAPDVVPDGDGAVDL